MKQIVSMPPDGSDTAPATPRETYIHNILDELDKKMKEWHEQGKKKAELSPPQLCGLAEMNYNTMHKNTVFQGINSKLHSFEYKKWKGIRINIEDYLIEREIIEPEQDQEGDQN